MARFAIHQSDSVVEILFDDGGMNLLSRAALEELAGAIRTLPLQGVDTLVFRSGRPPLFAAGADMNEMRAFDGWQAWEFARCGQELFAAIERLPVLTVCFVDGDCFGGALDLAMAFDLRVASARSRLSHPGAKIGIVTGFGGTSRWRSLVKPEAARRLFLSNEVLTATAAVDAGLVDWISDIVPSFCGDMVTRRFLKELSRTTRRLSPREQLLFARRLGNVYFAASLASLNEE